MSLVLNTNINSMMTQRSLASSNNNVLKIMEKLSTGMRINKAADDAAGLQLSEQLKSQIGGSKQAYKNSQDGISMMQIAEGGLSKIHDLLQRGRDLAVQASNGVYSDDEKSALQLEVAEILKEIDQISNSTEFNGIGLLDGSVGEALSDFQTSIINSLKSGWLDDAQNKIGTYYGLTPSNFDMELFFHDDIASGALAYVASSKYGDGSLAELSLHINEKSFTPNSGDSGANSISGSSTGMYNDMILAHELTHAVIADQIDDRIPTWFNEGCAEFLVGRDNQLKAVTNNNNPADVAGLVEEAAQLVEDEDWYGTGSYFNYSVGYFATKFLAQKLSDDGASLVDVFDDLEAGDDLETAIANNTTYNSLADFANDIRANGAAYYGTLDFTGGVGTAEADTGSVQGSDHGGGAVNAVNAIQSIGNNENPTNFNIIYPDSNDPIELQVGANVGDTISLVGPNVSSSALGISDIDVSFDSRDAIQKLDNAIEEISTQRSKVGSLQTRLEGVLDTLSVKSENLKASNSIIRDADIGAQTADLAREQILQQSASILLAQANQSNAVALTLL